MPELFDRSPAALVDALCQRIEKVLAPSFWYPGEDGEYHTPHVHAQHLPVSKTESKERNKSKDYPIVQVICVSGEISDFSEVPNGSEIKIQIQFGGYNDEDDNQGWRIPTAMLWRTLQDLLSDTIIVGYQLTAPIKWTPLNSKEPPYFAATMETVWKGCPPAVEVPFDEEFIREESNEQVPVAQVSDVNESGVGINQGGL
jgi:hypothetical protein